MHADGGATAAAFEKGAGMSLLAGKVAIVTGAGRGLGREEALALARERARVIVNDIGVSVTARASDESPAAAGRRGDRSAPAARPRRTTRTSRAGKRRGKTIEQAYDKYGRSDILVNNAGVLRDRMSFNMTEEEFDLVMRVHCKGHFAMIRHACVRWRESAKQAAAACSAASSIRPPRPVSWAPPGTAITRWPRRRSLRSPSAWPARWASTASPRTSSLRVRARA